MCYLHRPTSCQQSNPNRAETCLSFNLRRNLRGLTKLTHTTSSPSLSNSLTPLPRPYLDPIPAQQTDRGPLTSTPLRPIPCQPHAHPTGTFLTPVTGSPELFSPIGTGTTAEVKDTVVKIDRGLCLNDEQSKTMQKWADSRSHIEHLTKVDVTPPKEELPVATVYDFVNIVDKNNEDKEFVVSVLDGNE